MVACTAVEGVWYRFRCRVLEILLGLSIPPAWQQIYTRDALHTFLRGAVH